MDADKPICAPVLQLAPHVHVCDLVILLNHVSELNFCGHP